MVNDQKVVLVTGASSGIGKCCAEYLCNKGYRVYGTSRKADSFDSKQRPLNINSIQMIRMDVTDGSSVKQAIEHILDRESRIDALVNNAGIAIIGSLEDTTIEEAKLQLETNFFGALRVCRAVLPTMRKQQSGYIINISSIGGLIALPFQSAYSASKFALEGAMEALRLEVSPFGIQVVLIEPGDFKTKITRHRQKTAKSNINSVYFETFENVLQAVESGELNGPTPEVIAELTYKVINLNLPRIRYTVGTISQRSATLLKKLLPSRLFESLVKKTFHVS